MLRRLSGLLLVFLLLLCCFLSCKQNENNNGIQNQYGRIIDLNNYICISDKGKIHVVNKKDKWIYPLQNDPLQAESDQREKVMCLSKKDQIAFTANTRDVEILKSDLNIFKLRTGATVRSKLPSTFLDMDSILLSPIARRQSNLNTNIISFFSSDEGYYIVKTSGIYFIKNHGYQEICLTNDSIASSLCSASFDGQFIYYCTSDHCIKRVNIKNKQVTNLHTNADRILLTSEGIYYREFSKNESYLGFMKSDGSDKRQIINMNYIQLSYSEDDHSLYYINPEDEQTLWSYNLQSKTKKKISDKRTFSFCIIQNENLICAEVYESDNSIQSSYYLFDREGENTRSIEINQK